MPPGLLNAWPGRRIWEDLQQDGDLAVKDEHVSKPGFAHHQLVLDLKLIVLGQVTTVNGLALAPF